MKGFQRIGWILMLCLCLLLSACGTSGGGNVDVDLTQMSETVAYSQAYAMVTAPEDYLGKTVRMSGTYSAYVDPNTQAVYYACLIADTAACCSVPIEFVAGDITGLPEYGSVITVTGVFGTYQEGGNRYCQLTDAVIES